MSGEANPSTVCSCKCKLGFIKLNVRKNGSLGWDEQLMQVAMWGYG